MSAARASRSLAISISASASDAGRVRVADDGLRRSRRSDARRSASRAASTNTDCIRVCCRARPGPSPAAARSRSTDSPLGPRGARASSALIHRLSDRWLRAGHPRVRADVERLALAHGPDHERADLLRRHRLTVGLVELDRQCPGDRAASGRCTRTRRSCSRPGGRVAARRVLPSTSSPIALITIPGKTASFFICST